MAGQERMMHKPTVKEVSYMIDQCFCSCGWKSDKFWDGAEYAYAEWKKHAKQELPREKV